MADVRLLPSQKAALVLSILDEDSAIEIIKKLSDTEVGIIAEEVAKLKDIDSMMMGKILVEFTEEMDNVNYFDDLKEVLKKALGTRKSEEILSLINPDEERPFHGLANLTGGQLLYMLAGENPQTIALVLYFVTSDKAAEVFSKISPKIRGEVIMRMATMELPPKSLLMKISLLIEAKAKKTEIRQETPKETRMKTIADIISRMDRAMERSVTDFVEKKDPKLCAEIRKRLFVFEDIVYVLDEGLRKAVSGIDSMVVALALKTAGMEVREKILKNISQRIRNQVQEEIDAMGPKRLAEVEDAQQKIVEAVKQIDAREGPIIMRGEEKEVQYV